MYIHIEKTKLNNLSKQINENAQEIQKIVKELLENTLSLASCWSGDSYDKFQKKINENYEKDILEFQNKLMEYAEYLQSATEFYQQLENTFSEKEIEV